MKLSWSHKLFLRINEQLGKRPHVDALMKFFGSILIFVLFFCFFLIFLLRIFERKMGLHHLEMIVFSFFIAYLISYTLALLFPHERPIKELPQIKNLFPTLSTWKSFPSDHTIAVFLFTFHAWNLFGFQWGYFFLLGAILVSAGRVYGGVHYPRDILGGVLVALIAMVGAWPVLQVFL